MSEADGHVENTITGGLFFHAVVQGRDVTVHLPLQIIPALSGLPAPSTTFTRREELLNTLLEHLTPKKGRGGVPVSALAGLAGIGKTELAVHTAKEALQRTGWFPGGALFIDLFGYDTERRLSPEQAPESLLRALAVPGEHIPDSLEDRQRLYRSVLAHYAQEGRRILVVVDNASTAAQAGPLLPTDGVTAALVTSRHTLDGLEGGRYLFGVGGQDQCRTGLAHRGPSDTTRPRHRTALLPALPVRRLLARPDVSPGHCPDRGRSAPRGAPTAGGRDQRPFPCPVRDVRLRGELRHPDRQRPARPRLHLDRQQLPPPRRGPRVAAR